MSSETKFERIYEDENSKQVWKYDYSITKSGPVSVTTTYKYDPMEKKTLKDLVPKKKTKKK